MTVSRVVDTRINSFFGSSNLVMFFFFLVVVVGFPVHNHAKRLCFGFCFVFGLWFGVCLVVVDVKASFQCCLLLLGDSLLISEAWLWTALQWLLI